MSTGIDGFVTALEAWGFDVTRQAGIISYPVQVVAGQLAGTTVETGVDEAELGRWPMTPPHWVHLPSSINYPGANSQPSARPGWKRHSWATRSWGVNERPVRAWLAHVQDLLGGAHE